MPAPTFPFNNTDLHNIYDAIVAGGGGGSALAGNLLDGSVNPSVPLGFYPYKLTEINSNVATISAKSVNTNGLLNGTDDPSDYAGFYPDKIYNIYTSINAVNDLLQGYANPGNFGGFYPDTLDAIKLNTKDTETHTQQLMANQQFGDTTTALTYYGNGGFASIAAAAADATTYMNGLSGIYNITTLQFTDGGGANNHSYIIVYR